MNSVPKEKSKISDRRLYLGAALIATLIMIAGFARTYYFMGLFNNPSLSTLLHVHGMVMTLWFAVFITQVLLVRVRRVNLHRSLGWIAAGLSIMVVTLGFAAGISGARNGHTNGDLPPLVFLMFPLSIMLIFALLTGIAVYYRRRSDIHKRLMLLASLNMLTPAIARIPGIESAGPPLFLGLTILLVIGCVAYDTIQNRRLHPAYGWGGGLLIISFPLRFLLAHTDAWLNWATWLVAYFS